MDKQMLFNYKSEDLESYSKELTQKNEIEITLAHVGEGLVTLHFSHEEYEFITDCGGLDKSEIEELVEIVKENILSIEYGSQEYNNLKVIGEDVFSSFNLDICCKQSYRCDDMIAFWNVWCTAK